MLGLYLCPLPSIRPGGDVILASVMTVPDLFLAKENEARDEQ